MEAARSGGEGSPVTLAHFDSPEFASPRVIKTHSRRRLLLGLEVRIGGVCIRRVPLRDRF